MTSAQTPQRTASGEKVFAERELVVVCAFCGRMRSRDGLWISLPPCPSHVLRQEVGWISHTYCPECLARHFPKHRTGAAQSGVGGGEAGRA